MFRSTLKEKVYKLTMFGTIVFLGLMIMIQGGYASGKDESCIDSVSKLKYADPVKDIHLYLNAFHTAKENPAFEVEAHHYCSMRNLDVRGESLHQCVIYDSNEAPAKLLGIEYIISDEVYQKLPLEEKRYWHPHAYEVISGQLIVPDLPDMGNQALEGFITSWGKTFHTWPDPETSIPMGEPILMWSAGADGQISKEMLSKRDKSFAISSDELRSARKKYGYQVPTVDLPHSVDEIGRQWTSEGPDKPERLK